MDPETIPRSRISLPIEDDPTDALPVRETSAQTFFPSCTVTHGGHIRVEAEPGGKEATCFLTIPDRR
jgi:hypothetical protein